MKLKWYLNIFWGLIFIIMDFNYHPPAPILIKVDLLNDFLGAWVLCSAVYKLNYKNWLVISFTLLMLGILDFFPLSMSGELKLLSKVISVSMWFIFINKVAESPDIKEGHWLKRQGMWTFCIWTLALVIFLMPQFLLVPITGGILSFVLFICMVNFLFFIPYLLVANTIKEEFSEEWERSDNRHVNEDDLLLVDYLRLKKKEKDDENGTF